MACVSGYVAFNIEKSEKDDVDEEPEQPYKLPDGSTIQVTHRRIGARLRSCVCSSLRLLLLVR